MKEIIIMQNRSRTGYRWMLYSKDEYDTPLTETERLRLIAGLEGVMVDPTYNNEHREAWALALNWLRSIGTAATDITKEYE